MQFDIVAPKLSKANTHKPHANWIPLEPFGCTKGSLLFEKKTGQATPLLEPPPTSQAC